MHLKEYIYNNCLGDVLPCKNVPSKIQSCEGELLFIKVLAVKVCTHYKYGMELKENIRM